MIVLDASAAGELVLETDAGSAVARRLRGERVHVPAHFDVEVVSLIRQAVRRGLLSERDGLVAVADFRSVPARRWPLPPLLDRAYSLRETHSVADACYVALAEALDTPLLTCDQRLARSHGHHALVEGP